MQFPTESAQELLRMALAEDVGSGDVTTALSCPPEYDPVSTVRLISKAQGILCGLPMLDMTLAAVAPNAKCTTYKKEGDTLAQGDLVADIVGPAREILTAERTFLNFMQRMSGVATVTAQYAAAAAPAVVLDTRKTLPGWRLLDKYAVRVGGGRNHRIGLYDMVLIKDNHIAAAGGVQAALTNTFARLPAGMKVEIEVENLQMLRDALAFPIDRIMLDNMSLEEMALCVREVRATRPQVEIEASGNMTLGRLKEVAATGVDLISVGALTHSVEAFDLSLRYV